MGWLKSRSAAGLSPDQLDTRLFTRVENGERSKHCTDFNTAEIRRGLREDCDDAKRIAPCTFTVTFTPSIMRTESATYLVYDNSPGSPQSLPLTGTGN
jgi:hypothetical protein